MYEDERGVWQNRIENLWSSVYDRAKVTNSTSVALFNKIAESLTRAYDRIFGHRLLSVRAFVVSTNLSMFGAVCLYVGVLCVDLKSGIPLLVLFCFPLAPLAILILLPLYRRQRWALLVSSLPLALFALLTVTNLFYESFAVRQIESDGAMSLLLLASFLSDFLTVVVSRRIITGLSRSLSNVRIVRAVLLLLLLAVAVFASPYLVQDIISPVVQEVPFGLMLSLLNVATAIMCIIPIFTLLFVLLHKLLWPFLSRLLYPLASLQIVGNRKVLVSVGSFCWLVGLGLKPVTVSNILKLFS